MAAQVEIRFGRRNSWPKGACYAVLWNGRIDSATGDGLPALDPGDPVDEANPLIRRLIALWPNEAKAGFGAEPAGAGVYGHPANYGPAAGYGRGRYGIGEYGTNADEVVWSTASVLPALRDGAYKFAVRLEDANGTPQTADLTILEIEVRGRPRPPRRPRFVQWNHDEQTATIAWEHSLDLVDLA